MGEKCQWCGIKAESKCSSCLLAVYCSKEHQKKDWKNHKLHCVPYMIKENDTLGRHLIAQRDISKGDIVLCEKPLIAGPCQTTGPVCLGCHNGLKLENYTVCDDCGWPMCSKVCASSLNHKPECDWVKISQFVSPHPTYACITPLRACYMRNNNKNVWNKLSKLNSHCEDRKKDGKYEQDRFCVAKLLKRFYKLDDFEEDEILKITGILQINSHLIPISEPDCIALFYHGSFLEHSCMPNCSKTFSDIGELLIRAAIDIKKGENLSINYVDPIWPTLARRTLLNETKYFACECPRCSDPTEFGTNFSSFLCRKCSGVVLPKSFLSKDSFETWKCLKCNDLKNKEEVCKVLEHIAVLPSKIEKTSIESHFKCLEALKEIIPESGGQIIDVKLSLAQVIGQTTKMGLEDVNDEMLNLKERLCRELLQLSTNIFRAECRILGVLYFELHATVAEKSRRIVKNKNLTKALLKESGDILEKCLFYLKYEPQSLPEGRIYHQATTNLASLRDLYEKMGF